MSDFIRKPNRGSLSNFVESLSFFWLSLKHMVSEFREQNAAETDDNDYFTYSGMGSVMGFVHVKPQTAKSENTTKGSQVAIEREVQTDKQESALTFGSSRFLV